MYKPEDIENIEKARKSAERREQENVVEWLKSL